MGTIFVNQEEASVLDEIEDYEKFLEDKTGQKVIVLPIFCSAHFMHLSDGSLQKMFYVIQQELCSTVTKEQQDHIIEKIKEKTGFDTFFLYPCTTLEYIP